ncbi:MAG: hypothetical protein RLZ75_2173 [Pseudomonadota bacterium]
MTKVKGPLFSLAASGCFNGIMEFRTCGSGTIVHKIRNASTTCSPAQKGQRDRFKAAVAGWNALSDIEKQQWKVNAQQQHQTGYHFYLMTYASQIIS